MHIEMVDAVIDPGNDDAPLSYIVDGTKKQIKWSDLTSLHEERCAEKGHHHTEEQKLLARIVHEHWIDSDDWWRGASASSELPGKVDVTTSTNCPGSMNHYQQLIEDEIRTVQGQKDHCIGVLNAGGLQSWASKEYSALVEQYDKKLIELNGRLPLPCDAEL